MLLVRHWGKRKIVVVTRVYADVANKFAASAWGKKLARQAAKAKQTDFDRFKAAIVKAKKARAVRKVRRALRADKKAEQLACLHWSWRL